MIKHRASNEVIPINVILVLITMLSLSMSSWAVTKSDSPTIATSLKEFLQIWNGKPDHTRYISVFQDLNGDGKEEAIVYLIGNRWCGSGGCNTLILKRYEMSWKIVSNIRITNTPIRVLAKVSHGWHSIGVLVAGGGITHAYEAEMDFDGNSYPLNPTVPPARKLKSKIVGEIIIPSTAGALPLYDQ